MEMRSICLKAMEELWTFLMGGLAPLRLLMRWLSIWRTRRRRGRGGGGGGGRENEEEKEERVKAMDETEVEGMRRTKRGREQGRGYEE